MKDVTFDNGKINSSLALFLPFGTVELCMDRTEWNFGSLQINILAVTAYCQGIGIPLCFELLENNSGNSSVEDRGKIIEQAVNAIGKERITCVKQPLKRRI